VGSEAVKLVPWAVGREVVRVGGMLQMGLA